MTTNVKVTSTRTVDVRLVVWVAVAGLLVWALGTVLLISSSHVFDVSTTVIGSDQKAVTISTFDLTTAKFATVGLCIFGALMVVVGVVVAVAEVTAKTVTQTTGDAAVAGPVNGGDEAIGAASGAAAVGVMVGEVIKSLGTALKDAKASTALLIVGGALFIFGGVVAWQTVPGTDRSPTISVSTVTSESVTATSSSAGSQSTGAVPATGVSTAVPTSR